MANKTYLDKSGLTYFWSKIKNAIPKKTSDLQNDSNFTTDEIYVGNNQPTGDDVKLWLSNDDALIGEGSYISNEYGESQEIGYSQEYINNQIAPRGSIQMFSGSTAPSGWLICDGSAVSRTTYSKLFEVIGTTYGTGDGSTTFNLPNLKGRVPTGYDANDSLFNTLGKTGGSKDLQINMNMFLSSGRLYIDYQSDSGSNYYEDSRKWVPNGTSESGRHEQSNATIHMQGKTDSTNCLPPYIVMNYIIKY